MKKIDQAIEMVTNLLEEFNTPITYQEPEYYERCQAKADILEEVLANLKSIKEQPK